MRSLRAGLLRLAVLVVRVIFGSCVDFFGDVVHGSAFLFFGFFARASVKKKEKKPKLTQGFLRPLLTENGRPCRQ
jgi:hypothetical protein